MGMMLTSYIARLLAAAALVASALMIGLFLIMTAGYVGAIPDAPPLTSFELSVICGGVVSGVSQFVLGVALLFANPGRIRHRLRHRPVTAIILGALLLLIGLAGFALLVFTTLSSLSTVSTMRGWGTAGAYAWLAAVVQWGAPSLLVGGGLAALSAPVGLGKKRRVSLIES